MGWHGRGAGKTPGRGAGSGWAGFVRVHRHKGHGAVAGTWEFGVGVQDRHSAAYHADLLPQAKPFLLHSAHPPSSLSSLHLSSNIIVNIGCIGVVAQQAGRCLLTLAWFCDI